MGAKLSISVLLGVQERTAGLGALNRLSMKVATSALEVYKYTMPSHWTCSFTLVKVAANGYQGRFEIFDASGRVVGSGEDDTVHVRQQQAWMSIWSLAQVAVAHLSGPDG